MNIAFVFVICFSAPAFTAADGDRKYKEEELDAPYWHKVADNILQNNLKLRNIEKPAKNIIFFLGDGMSIATVTASRIYDGQLKGQSGEDNVLYFETFPNVALSKTYNVDKQVPDSAGTATAFLGGVKGNYYTTGVTARVKFQDCEASLNTTTHVSSIIKWAQDAGKETGFVTTMRVTHATPAGLYAHVAERNWESDINLPNNSKCRDIATQLVEGDTGPGIKVILGGGKFKFYTKPEKFWRKDGKNLTDTWLKSKSDKGFKPQLVFTLKELNEVDVAKTDYLFGLFNDDHMTDEVDRTPECEEPTIANMTKKAIEMLSKDNKPYFLFVEGGKIDWSHHAGKAKRALAETVAFNEAIKTAGEMTSQEDTLIVVTADHSHVMTINGYPQRGNSILGTVESIAEDLHPGLPYTTLMYTNGPGYNESIRINVSATANDNYHQLAAFPKLYETHGGDDVAIYARGPMAHLFRGVVEQNYIPHALAYAACYNEDFNACKSFSNRFQSNSSVLFALVAIISLINSKILTYS